MGTIISSIWQTNDGVTDAYSMDNWFAPFHSEKRGEYINDIIHNCHSMLYVRPGSGLDRRSVNDSKRQNMLWFV